MNEMDERFERTRELDGRYVMQTYRRLPVSFVRGRGTRLWDTEGREYLDLLSGLGVTVLGHCHPAVTGAVCRQAEALMHTTNLYYVEPQAEVARLLVENTVPGRCFFANSGAEANEGALKLARKHHYSAGCARHRVVCVRGSFHGRTLATLSATGQPDKWAPFEPVVPGFHHVPVNDVAALREAVDRETAAVFLEPVLGEGGVYPLKDEYLAAAREACDETGALLIVDEIQSGMGRTGRMFAYQHSGIEPDIVTVAKGLANGVPAAAFVARGELGDVLSPGEHGTTFGGGFLACAAARATLETMIEEDVPGHAGELGSQMLERMESMVSEIPAVTGARGLGMMLALQLDREAAAEIVSECLRRGVLVNNVAPDAVRLLPPLIIEPEEAFRGLKVLGEVLSSL